MKNKKSYNFIEKVIFFIIVCFKLFSFNILYSQPTNPTENVKIHYDEIIEIQSGKYVIVPIDIIVPKGNHIYIKHIEPDSWSILTKFSIE